MRFEVDISGEEAQGILFVDLFWLHSHIDLAVMLLIDIVFCDEFKCFC